MLSDREMYLFYSIMVVIAVIVIPVCVKVTLNHIQGSSALKQMQKSRKEKVDFLTNLKEGVYVFKGKLFIVAKGHPTTPGCVEITTLNLARCFMTPSYKTVVDTRDRGIFAGVTLTTLMEGPLLKVEGVTAQQLHLLKNSLAWDRVDRHKFMYNTTPAYIKHQLALLKIIHEP